MVHSRVPCHDLARIGADRHSTLDTEARRIAANIAKLPDFASEIKRALNQGLIESVTYDRGAIFFDAHLGPE